MVFGCSVENYDYAHLPFRFFDNFLPMTDGDFFSHEQLGLMTAPKMLSLALHQTTRCGCTTYFLKDTSGLDMGNPTSIGEPIEQPNNQFLVYPNPSHEELFDLMDSDFDAVAIEVYDKKSKASTGLCPRTSTVGVNVHMDARYLLIAPSTR